MMDWKKYAYTFLITAAIFATAILASNYFNQRRINEIRNIQSSIAIDILSSETQFSLLQELSCRDVNNSLLSKELRSLGERLSYTEENLGADDPEVIDLKRYYSLLQIKDFLLMQKIREKCGAKLADSDLSVIYFYSNEEGECPDCEREGLVLTRLREDYPEFRVYSFDYNLSLSAVQTLTSLYNVQPLPAGGLPALIIKDRVYYGFHSIEAIKDIIPKLKELDKKRELEEEQASSTNKNN